MYLRNALIAIALACICLRGDSINRDLVKLSDAQQKKLTDAKLKVADALRDLQTAKQQIEVEMGYGPVNYVTTSCLQTSVSIDLDTLTTHAIRTTRSYNACYSSGTIPLDARPQ